MAQRGQEGAQGHTASRGMQTKTGMRLYLSSLGLLCPLIPSFPPPQKMKMFLERRQKNVKLKSEPWVLGKEYREVRRILDEQRSAYPADGKHSGLSKASSCAGLTWEGRPSVSRWEQRTPANTAR